MIKTDFSAKEPSLGYFYQLKFALLILLTNSKELENPKVRIENLDDVEIEDINSMNLYQTKLHIKNKANLTNASVDFWKTIRIWAEQIESGIIDLDCTTFNLVTTENVPNNSILFHFTENNFLESEIEKIIEKLELTATNSENIANSKAYKAFLTLPLDKKKKLIKNIRIIDNTVGIVEIDKKIKKQLIFSTYPTHLDAFLELLEGWWFKKSIENLVGAIDAISSVDLQLKIANISDSFKADNLPNHFPDQIDISDDEVNTMKEKNFLKQLDLIEIGVNSRAVKRAISDFRRAFAQRSKWLRLHLLNPEEEEEYDRKLKDYWYNIFEIMCDETDGKSDAELKIFGKKFYIDQFAKTCPKIKIRKQFNEDYLTRGSYQMLSDEKKIGWHPKFEDEI